RYVYDSFVKSYKLDNVAPTGETTYNIYIGINPYPRDIRSPPLLLGADGRCSSDLVPSFCMDQGSRVERVLLRLFFRFSQLLLIGRAAVSAHSGPASSPNHGSVCMADRGSADPRS